MDLAINAFEKSTIVAPNIINQCYDGVSVMRGEKGRVLTLLQNKFLTTLL